MDYPENRWTVLPEKPELQQILQHELKISPILSRLLVNRSIISPPDAEKFLAATLSDLSHPFLMKDNKKACQRIIEAVYHKEKICIYGDYDADGVTGTAILKDFLTSLGAPVIFYVPDRLSEGYGLHIPALDQVRAQGVSLIITVDCGVSNVEEVLFARERGIDVIITDHHHVPERLPDAYAILNPKQADCSFPFKHLAGVGVAFYLVIALRRMLREEGYWSNGQPPNLRDYLDLVALGTLADVVPLRGENRIFVRYGLEVMRRRCRPGIAALKRVSRVENGMITPDVVSYRFAPRINAAGRLGKADRAVLLLTTTDAAEAHHLARELDNANAERQGLENIIFRQACQRIEESETPLHRNIIILESSEWHPGVLGIGAARLVERYYRPTILIALDGDTGHGSARSIEAFHLYEGLRECQDLLEKFGGHEFAAGLTITRDKIDSFRARLNMLVTQALRPDDFIPRIYIDAHVDLAQVNETLIEEIQCLAPFGTQNPAPLFLSDIFSATAPHIVGNRHLKMFISGNRTNLEAIGFGMADLMPLPDSLIRAVFSPEINVWQGTRKIQLTMKDLRIQVK